MYIKDTYKMFIAELFVLAQTEGFPSVEWTTKCGIFRQWNIIQ